jgi:hypothetical protein
MIKNVYRSLCQVPHRYSCKILIKFEFSGQFFGKYSNINVKLWTGCVLVNKGNFKYVKWGIILGLLAECKFLKKDGSS